MIHRLSHPLRAVCAWALVCTSLTTQAAEGEVKKIDLAQSKITIKHGEIKNIGMPAMTMVFRAKAPAMLNALSVGDQISFEADRVDGQYVVTAIKKR